MTFPPRFFRSTTQLAVAAFVLGALHRAAQLALVAGAVGRQAALNAGWQSTQYLPADLFEQHFAAAMLYLQQTPPLPNLLIGVLSRLSLGPDTGAIVTIAFAGLLSCMSGALLVVLLSRLGVRPLFAFAIALLFLGNSGVVLLEYTAFGQCFYEQLAMLGCLLAALAAVALTRRQRLAPAIWLGLAVALLALSRATFSYFAIPVLAWLLWQRIQPRYIVAFLVPIALLHGGWAAKQYVVQGQWLWATSTWAGANAQAGDVKRHGAWHASKKVDCFERWSDALDVPATISFSIARFYPEPDLARSLDALDIARGPSATARTVDLAAAAARGQWVVTDSASFRELSNCVQHMYMRYWWRHPDRALSGWAQSYVQFWLPLDSYTALLPTTLVAVYPTTQGPPRSLPTELWHRLVDRPEYLVRQEKMPWIIGTSKPVLVPANVVVIPWAPQFATLVAFAMLHGIPFAAAYIRMKKHSLEEVFPQGFSFLLLTYAYVAAICNLVEYGENMRFRLAVEPIVWAIGIVVAGALARSTGWTGAGAKIKKASA